MSKFATVFARFHSNRLLKTLTDGIFVFKSKQQCLLPKKSKFVALLTNLEISPAHCLKFYIKMFEYLILNEIKIKIVLKHVLCFYNLVMYTILIDQC